MVPSQQPQNRERLSFTSSQSANDREIVFSVVAARRSLNDAETLRFLIKAPSHRLAWQIARQVCRTGVGALYRDPTTEELHEFPLARGSWTPKRVLSTEPHRRGRKPRLTTEDLLFAAEDAGITIPSRVKELIARYHTQ